MHRDYQTLALSHTAIVSGGTFDPAAQTKGPGGEWDHMTIVCLAGGSLVAVVQKFPHPSFASDSVVAMAPGGVVYDIKSCSVSGGQFQIIFHKS